MPITKMSTGVELDTDSISPDSLKAAFDVAIDSLLSRANRNVMALDWNSLEVALHRLSDEDTTLVVRAGVIPS